MCFAKAKLEQFKSIVNDPEAKGDIIGALKRANYRIEMEGNTTHAIKGHAIISFDGVTSDAMVTPMKMRK